MCQYKTTDTYKGELFICQFIKMLFTALVLYGISFSFQKVSLDTRADELPSVLTELTDNRSNANAREWETTHTSGYEEDKKRHEAIGGNISIPNHRRQARTPTSSRVPSTTTIRVEYTNRIIIALSVAFGLVLAAVAIATLVVFVVFGTIHVQRTKLLNTRVVPTKSNQSLSCEESVD